MSICQKLGLDPVIPDTSSKLGLALDTIGESPINGLRHKETGDTNGWYIWCGESMGEEHDFFSPLHVEHISEYLPEVIDYLHLPPGYRFLIDKSGYKDIWYDGSLLETSE